MSLRTSTVAAVRRRLPELDDEAAWRGALAGAASLFMLLVAIAVLVPAARPARHRIARARAAAAAADRHERRAHALADPRPDQRADVQLPLHSAVLLVPHRVVGEHRRVPDLHPDRGRARQLRRRLPLGQRGRRSGGRAAWSSCRRWRSISSAATTCVRRCAGRSPTSARASACAAPRCASRCATASSTSGSAATPRRPPARAGRWARPTAPELVTLRGEDGVLALPISDSGDRLRLPRRRHRAPARRGRDGRRAGVVLQHPRPRARA